MAKRIKVEVCCGRIEDCHIAITQDIDRIELNSALELGGLTPSLGTVIEALKLPIPIITMVRPRTAGFCYSDSDYQSMLFDAINFLEQGVDGLVFGFLTSEGKIDLVRTKAFSDLCKEYNKEAVFHKAFDSVCDFDEAIKQLISLGINRILTGGGTGKIDDNLAEIARLQKEYGHLIEILPGGGVRHDNIEAIFCTKVEQIHMTAKKEYDDLSMSAKNPHAKHVYLGTDLEYLKKAIEIIRR